MERILIEFPHHYPGCAFCPFAEDALKSSSSVPIDPRATRMEIEVACVPPVPRYNGTSAYVTAEVTIVLPNLGGRDISSPYNHPVQCPVAVERLLGGKK